MTSTPWRSRHSILDEYLVTPNMPLATFFAKMYTLFCETIEATGQIDRQTTTEAELVRAFTRLSIGEASVAWMRQMVCGEAAPSSEVLRDIARRWSFAEHQIRQLVKAAEDRRTPGGGFYRKTQGSQQTITEWPAYLEDDSSAIKRQSCQLQVNSIPVSNPVVTPPSVSVPPEPTVVVTPPPNRASKTPYQQMLAKATAEEARAMRKWANYTPASAGNTQRRHPPKQVKSIGRKPTSPTPATKGEQQEVIRCSNYRVEYIPLTPELQAQAEAAQMPKPKRKSVRPVASSGNQDAQARVRTNPYRFVISATRKAFAVAVMKDKTAANRIRRRAGLSVDDMTRFNGNTSRTGPPPARITYSLLYVLIQEGWVTDKDVEELRQKVPQRKQAYLDSESIAAD